MTTAIVPVAEMTAEQKRIRIAELCGWRKLTVQDVKNDDSGEIDPDPEHTITGWFAPDAETIPKNWHDEQWLPDYLNDLNAMHEAEKVLTPAQKSRYVDEIARGVTARGITATEAFHFHYVCATAAQRADAFLLTLDK